MNDIPITDQLFLILHRAAWSTTSNAFIRKDSLSWLVFGTHGDHSIQASGKNQEEAPRHVEELGLVQPI
jgi:hypothetical protein